MKAGMWEVPPRSRQKGGSANPLGSLPRFFASSKDSHMPKGRWQLRKARKFGVAVIQNEVFGGFAALSEPSRNRNRRIPNDLRLG